MSGNERPDEEGEQTRKRRETHLTKDVIGGAMVGIGAMLLGFLTMGLEALNTAGPIEEAGKGGPSAGWVMVALGLMLTIGIWILHRARVKHRSETRPEEWRL